MPLKKDEADKLIEAIALALHKFVGDDTEITGTPAKLDANLKVATSRQVGAAEVGAMIDSKDARAFTLDEEALYQRFRARIIDDAQIDPLLLRLLAVQPEMIVEYERKTETLDGSSLRGRIAKLIAQGFLNEPRTTGNVRTELMRTGSEPNSGGLSTALAALVGSGFLVRAGGEGWVKAPGVKVREKELEAKV